MTPPVRIYLAFCRPFAAALLALTGFLGYVAWCAKDGIWHPLLWFKILTTLLVVYVADRLKHAEYPYYANLGISKARLWIPVILADMLLFGLVMAVATLTPYVQLWPDTD